ncbi:MAG: ABC transporter substrate-binding protein [Alphaproteobacteria bacterium]|nr:ABC transporter substrate-binding protein [Alphaproteobacteria bacterium]
MSASTHRSGIGGVPAARLRIGLLRLTDSAPVIVAHEFGYFGDEAVNTELSVEPSWANIADKLAFGFLDAAVIVPPLAFAVELGLRGTAQKLIIPCAISHGGNTITVTKDLAERTHTRAHREGAGIAQAFAREIRETPATLGIVHPYSTHNLLLRYWLATAGVVPEQDVKLVVVPPARTAQALGEGRIAGFCAGAPWGEIAVRAGAGATIAASKDIWQDAPEKAFAVRAQWADENPDALQGAIRALLRAAQFCDLPENASYVAALLSRRRYLDVDSHAIMASLPGGSVAPNPLSCFFRGAATFPWRSHALWFLREMARWKLISDAHDQGALANKVYRPDLYRLAASSMDVSAPLTDWKTEGAHAAGWTLEAAPSELAMAADGFCDGAVFDPQSVTRPAGALHNS